jgi:hypothetical protein
MRIHHLHERVANQPADHGRTERPDAVADSVAVCDA